MGQLRGVEMYFRHKFNRNWNRPMCSNRYIFLTLKINLHKDKYVLANIKTK